MSENSILENEIIDILHKAIEKLQGKDINIDIKRLRGKWEQYSRIRFGYMRIIVEFNFSKHKIYVHRIDYRGSVYA